MEAQMETQVLICSLGMCSCLFCDTQCFLSWRFNVVECCWILDVVVAGAAGAGGGDTEKEQEEDPKETMNSKK